MPQSSMLVNGTGVPVRTKFHEAPLYDPNEHGRKCAVCGGRDRWRQLVNDEVVGGWYHCRQPDIAAGHHDDMSHGCSTFCAGVPAA